MTTSSGAYEAAALRDRLDEAHANIEDDDLAQLVLDALLFVRATIRSQTEVASELEGRDLDRGTSSVVYSLRSPPVEMLRDVADSGAVPNDPRIKYVEVQIDRETWQQIEMWRAIDKITEDNAACSGCGARGVRLTEGQCDGCQANAARRAVEMEVEQAQMDLDSATDRYRDALRSAGRTGSRGVLVTHRLSVSINDECAEVLRSLRDRYSTTEAIRRAIALLAHAEAHALPRDEDACRHGRFGYCEGCETSRPYDRTCDACVRGDGVVPHTCNPSTSAESEVPRG